MYTQVKEIRGRINNEKKVKMIIITKRCKNMNKKENSGLSK